MVNEAGKGCGLVRRSNWRVNFLQIACRRCIRSRTYSSAALPGLALRFRRGSWHRNSSFRHLPDIRLILQILQAFALYSPRFCLGRHRIYIQSPPWEPFSFVPIHSDVLDRTQNAGGMLQEGIGATLARKPRSTAASFTSEAVSRLKKRNRVFQALRLRAHDLAAPRRALITSEIAGMSEITMINNTTLSKYCRMKAT